MRTATFVGARSVWVAVIFYVHVSVHFSITRCARRARVYEGERGGEGEL